MRLIRNRNTGKRLAHEPLIGLAAGIITLGDTLRAPEQRLELTLAIHLARGGEDGLVIALLVHPAGGQDRDAIGADERVVIIPHRGLAPGERPSRGAAAPYRAVSIVPPAPPGCVTGRIVHLRDGLQPGAIFIDYAHHQDMLQHNVIRLVRDYVSSLG